MQQKNVCNDNSSALNLNKKINNITADQWMLYADERFQNDKELVYGKSNEFTGWQYFYSPDKAWKSVKQKKME